MNAFNKKPVSKSKISASVSAVDDEVKNKKARREKKVVYIEIDDEVTTVYDRIKPLKMKNIYLVVPKRAMLFQSIINLKILKRKGEDLEKNIYIITNDQNGMHLARKIGLTVYDKLEGHEHPSLVSGRFAEDMQNITPLKASVNTFEEETPTRRNEKKFAISDLMRRGNKKGFSIMQKNNGKPSPKQIMKDKKKDEKGKLVLIAPNKQALVSLVIVSLIILLTITYIALPGATVALTPKSNILTTTVNVTLADIEANRAELDTHPLREIPSYQLTKKVEKVITYQSTGKDFKGSNSRGVVTVMNNSSSPWPLIAKTRFQTSDGLVFRAEQPITVPAAKDNKPGSTDITVVADPLDAYGQVIGERGNIKATKFFLPGLSPENQKKLTGESKADFSGGKTDVIKLISKEDLDAARKKMIDDLKASAQPELQTMVKERNESQKTNLVLLTGTDAIQVSEPQVIIPSGLEGQKLESFEVKGQVVATGTAYSKDELLEILKTELKLKKNPEKRLTYIDEDSFTYRITENDKPGKKIKITSTIKGIEEYEISPDKENGERLIRKIKEHIVSKKIDEAEGYIQNLPEIDKVHIESWPAWAPTLPGLPDNIKVEVKKAEK
jgi:hypothetical protein